MRAAAECGGPPGSKRRTPLRASSDHGFVGLQPGKHSVSASADLEADTAEIEVLPPAEVTTAQSRHTAVAPGTPLPWPLIWLATTFLVIAALTVVAIASSDDDEPPLDNASGPITSTPTRGASTTTVSTAAGPATRTAPAPGTLVGRPGGSATGVDRRPTG